MQLTIPMPGGRYSVFRLKDRRIRLTREEPALYDAVLLLRRKGWTVWRAGDHQHKVFPPLSTRASVITSPELQQLARGAQ